MLYNNAQRTSQTIKVLASILSEHGCDASAFFSEFAIDLNSPQVISDASEKIAETELIDSALTLLPRAAGYGLRVGEAMPVGIFGIWGLAIVTSPDIRSAFDTLVRYGQTRMLLSKVRLQENEERAIFVVEMDHLPRSIRRFVFERYFSVTSRFLLEVIPELDLTAFEIHLPFSDAIYQKELEQLTGLSVVPEALNYGIVADQRLLDLPLPATDPALHAHFLTQCDELLNQHHRLSGYAQTIRDYMLSSKQFSPRFEQIAKSLCMSERTLRRRLSEDDLNFNQIVLETRMTLARELLIESSLPVKAVAERLAYSEPASFARAFKRWWGVSPGQVARD